MRFQCSTRFASIAALVAIAACSKQDEPAATPKSTTLAEAGLQQLLPSACTLVATTEMSGIVGVTMSADGGNGAGTTVCRYRSIAGSTPVVEIKIDWGNGAAGMMGAGLVGLREPGIADPLAGLGDQAAVVGPTVWVRLGDDLVILTLSGIDDDVATAKRVIDAMRPRMGPSAQARSPGADKTLEQTAGIVNGLLNQLPGGSGGAAAASRPAGDEVDARSRPAGGDFSLQPASDVPAIRIPLVAGLTIVAAEHELQRGDYEPIVTVSRVAGDLVSTVFSANLPEGTRLVVDRDVRKEDLRDARAHRAWYESGDPRVFAGATSFGVSAAVYDDLKAKGVARVARLSSESSPLAALARMVGRSGRASESLHQGTLQRVEPHALAFPLLLNEEPVEVPVIHARAAFDDGTVDYYVLDDPANPLLLGMAGSSVGRVVRIAFPEPAAAGVAERLKQAPRVVLHGIYFDFGKATLRPESDVVVRDVANALARNPGWKVTVEGHTDDVGDATSNLDLSRRRAEAVKLALVERHRIAAARLATTGLGASRPIAANDTLSGRARNRRVELARQ